MFERKNKSHKDVGVKRKTINRNAKNSTKKFKENYKPARGPLITDGSEFSSNEESDLSETSFRSESLCSMPLDSAKIPKSQRCDRFIGFCSHKSKKKKTVRYSSEKKKKCPPRVCECDAKDLQKAKIQQERKHLCHFLDTLLIEMEAFDEARSIKQYNLSKNKSPPPNNYLCFPVTIKSVQDLGPSSLYIEWETTTNSEIKHLQIEVDGLLVNEKFLVEKNYGVVYDVDVNKIHEISLMAIPPLEIERKMDMYLDCLMDRFGIKRNRLLSKWNLDDVPKRTLETWSPSRYIYYPNQIYK